MFPFHDRSYGGAALAVCLSAVFVCAPHVRADDAAHSIANKFAEDTNESQAEQRTLIETMAELKKMADEARAKELAERDRSSAQRQAREEANRNSYGKEKLRQAREAVEAARKAREKPATDGSASTAKVAEEAAQRRAKEAAEAKARAEAQAKAKAEEEARLAREKAAREAKVAAEAEAARKAREKAAKEEAARAARVAEEAAQRRAKEAAEAKARAEAQAKAKAEEDKRLAREKAAREAKVAREAKAARKAREDAAREEAAKAARAAEEAARQRVKEAAEAKARAEAEVLAIAKAEEDKRLAREQAEHEAKLAAEAEAARKAREDAADRAAEDAARLAAEATAREAEAELAARERERLSHDSDREAQALAARLREARDKHGAAGATGTHGASEALAPRTGPIPDRVAAVPAVIKAPPQAMAKPQPGERADEQRVTILIVMEVGKTGWRRISKTADPMLCLNEHCYLSRGVHSPAEKLSRRAAFGPAVALGRRGASCRSSPACIFRGVDLEAAQALLQPIDLRVLRHDRRETRLIRADKTCDVVYGEVECGNTVRAAGWRAWIVPESVAKRAGAAALELALDDGLEAMD